MSNQPADDFDSFLDAAANVEGGTPSTGYYCRATYDFGFKVFKQGVSQGTFFPFNPRDEAAKEAAKTKANELAAHADGSKPDTVGYCVRLVVHRETVKARPVTWTADMEKVYPRFGQTNAFNDLWMPKLKALRIIPGTYWSHVILVPDPVQTQKDDKGNTRPTMVWLLDKVYVGGDAEAVCTREAEEANAKSGGGAATGTEDLPPQYDAKMWATYKPQVIDALAGKVPDTTGKPMPLRIAFVVTNYGVPEDWLKAHPGLMPA